MVQAFVIDPSVLIQAYIKDTQTARVQTLLAGLADPISVILHIPEFCLLECANVLWKQVRFHNASYNSVMSALVRLEGIPLTIHPTSALLS